MIDNDKSIAGGSMKSVTSYGWDDSTPESVELNYKRNKKTIKPVIILCVFSVIICAVIFVFLQICTFTYEYKLLDDGTYAIKSATKGYFADKAIIPDTYKGKPVSTISSGAFKEKTQIKAVVVSENIKKIESQAFFGCANVVDLNLGNVEEIGEEAFAKCSNLKEIIIPKSVKIIGNSAFSSCTKLQNVVYNAVECQDMTSSANLFKECAESGLSVVIGKDVKRIPANLLTCTYKTWNRNNETIYYIQYDHYVSSVHAQGNFLGTSHVMVMPFETWVLKNHSYNAYTSSNVTKIVFAQNSQCREIGAMAFYNTSIESIVFPESLTILEAGVLGNCEKLTAITFENTEGWQVCSDEKNESVDLTNESNNVNVFLEQYVNNKLEKLD